MARIRRTSSVAVKSLEGWHLALAPVPGVRPEETSALRWIDAPVPGTAADALRAAGAAEEQLFALDAHEVWYRCSFEATPGPASTRALRFGGLATICDAWVNGHHVLRSENMFLEHEVDVSALLAGTNALLLRFSPLEVELKKRRPRPRWKSQLGNHQNLRFMRASLVGHAAAWRVPPPVGPYREVWLEQREVPATFHADLRPTLGGDEGVVTLDLSVEGPAAAALTAASLAVGDRRAPLAIEAGRARGELRLQAPAKWWPASHGTPALYEAQVDLEIGGATITLDLGPIGFRRIEVDRAGGAFALAVNGVPIFARGAIWTPPDPLRFWASAQACEAALLPLRDGGGNMVRLSGCFTYPSAFFHDLCDRLGVLVWQDFMFGGFDYPDDEAFLATCAQEARQVCSRVQANPSLAVLCGGTEGEQTPAMMGGPWQQAGLRAVLADICAALIPDVPWVGNSPTGGALPFHPDAGVAHYYGIGAFMRPIDDVRRSDVRFASECLGFSNVPARAALDRWLRGGEAPVASPEWKAGVPRDHRASFDFDDVRDHYLRARYEVDPVHLRKQDPERYLTLSCAVTGEVMAEVLAEMRRVGSRCAGALIWVYCDMWPGAGYGVLGADGVPKPAFWMARRAMAPQAVLLTDEGLNGLAVHAINDRPEPLEADLSFALWRGRIAVAQASRRIVVPPHGALRVPADELLGRFTDSSYAYRFGPPAFEAAVATLGRGDSQLSSAFRFPGPPPWRSRNATLEAAAAPCPDGFAVHVRSNALAWCVHLDLPDGCIPSDDWFHLAPGEEREIVVAAAGLDRLRGTATPLNGVPASFSTERGAR